MLFVRWISRKVRLPVANPRQTAFLVIPQRSLPYRHLLDPVEFLSLADTYIAKVAQALSDLQGDNPASVLEFSKSRAAFTCDAGTFEVASNMRMQVLTVNIPRLGQFKYFYDGDNARWVGEGDGHLLEELLVRELMRVSKGYLKL